jgi:hypothetical protein
MRQTAQVNGTAKYIETAIYKADAGKGLGT